VTFIELMHEIQVAHRLTQLEGKCQNIHGHSMKVTLRLYGPFKEGYFRDREGRILDFGDCKSKFRDYLDSTYDHRLLLDKDDPWAQPLYHDYIELDEEDELPGLAKCPGDPTTENIATWVQAWAANAFDVEEVEVHVQETSTNGVGCA
jgi:6-pyruvoyltetrahydropterin/6-carboxytetrahydropterin synthase